LHSGMSPDYSPDSGQVTALPATFPGTGGDGGHAAVRSRARTGGVMASGHARA